MAVVLVVVMVGEVVVVVICTLTFRQCVALRRPSSTYR